MSRFSTHDAEAQGWVFVHAQKEESVITSETQGESRIVPGRYVAEKTVNGILVTEAAESKGRLLEQIHAYEERFQANTTAAEPDEQDEIVSFDVSEDGATDEDGEPIEADEDEPARPSDATVHLPDGSVISERAWANRGRRDVLVVADDDADEEDNPAGTKQVVVGGHQDAVEAAREVDEVQRAVEERRTQLPQYDTEQIDVEAPPIDNPGGHGGGRVVVREGETLEEAAERREEESSRAESDRVNASITPVGNPAPEDAPELAGVGAGVAERGDLASEQPRTTFEEAEAAVSAVDVETVEDRGEHPRQVESEAAEAKLKDIREKEGAAAAEKPEAAVAAREAGAEAVQKQADESSSEEKDEGPQVDARGDLVDPEADEPTPDATDAAIELAKEHEVDLDDVDGSGENGRIVKSDVEAFLDAEQGEEDPEPAEESAEDGT